MLLSLVLFDVARKRHEQSSQWNALAYSRH